MLTKIHPPRTGAAREKHARGGFVFYVMGTLSQIRMKSHVERTRPTNVGYSEIGVKGAQRDIKPFK